MAKSDIHQQVTDQIIASIEAGTPAWRKPWTGGTTAPPFPRRSNGEFYRGINVLMLYCTAAEKGYRSAFWFTFKQAKELNAHVRKGEKASTVVKYGTVERETDNGEEKSIPYAKAYSVFNADQIEGLPDEYHGKPSEPPRDLGTQSDPQLDAFFAATGAKVQTSTEPESLTRTDAKLRPDIASPCKHDLTVGIRTSRTPRFFFSSHAAFGGFVAPLRTPAKAALDLTAPAALASHFGRGPFVPPASSLTRGFRGISCGRRKRRPRYSTVPLSAPS